MNKREIEDFLEELGGKRYGYSDDHFSFYDPEGKSNLLLSSTGTFPLELWMYSTINKGIRS